MNIKEVNSIIEKYNEDYMINKVGQIIPDMAGTNYLITNKFFSSYIEKIEKDKEYSKILETIIKGWTWKDDSILGQPKDIQEKIVKLYKFCIK